MLKYLPALITLVVAGSSWSMEKSTGPEITIGKDGFPTGQNSPEGVACDMARAFIDADSELWKRIIIRSFMRGENQGKYVEFSKNIASQMALEHEKKIEERSGPRKLNKCFAARHLSHEGPASYGYATFDFQDVMFVDVQVLLANGKIQSNRTLVVKEKDGKWYVHPMPAVSPLLSAGLNDEKDSEKEVSVQEAGEKKSKPEPIQKKNAP